MLLRHRQVLRCSLAVLRPDLEYAIVAVSGTRGRGCIDGIQISQQEIDQRIARTETMFLEDFPLDISRNVLQIETHLGSDLVNDTRGNLQQIAALYESMIDGPYDPVDFIIDRSQRNGGILKSFMASIRDQLAQALYNESANAQLTKIKMRDFCQGLA